jgi:hypothetical protein
MRWERVLRLLIAIGFVILAIKLLLDEKKYEDWRKKWS